MVQALYCLSHTAVFFPVVVEGNKRCKVPAEGPSFIPRSYPGEPLARPGNTSFCPHYTAQQSKSKHTHIGTNPLGPDPVKAVQWHNQPFVDQQEQDRIREDNIKAAELGAKEQPGN